MQHQFRDPNDPAVPAPQIDVREASQPRTRFDELEKVMHGAAYVHERSGEHRRDATRTNLRPRQSGVEVWTATLSYIP